MFQRHGLAIPILALATAGSLWGLPMLLAIVAVLFSGERLHIGGWLALVASTVGAGLIALSSKQAAGTAYASVRGDLLVVISMFVAIAWTLISKTTHAAAFCADGYGLCALDRHSDLGGCGHNHIGCSASALAEQGLLATASTTVLWNWGLKRVPASQAGIFVNLEPLVGTILGVSLLDDVLGRMA